MKLAAMEGLYEGREGAGLSAFGILNPNKTAYNDEVKPYILNVEIPKLLSFLAYRDQNAFVPGVKDIIDGGYTLPDGTTALSFEERKARGEKAIQALADHMVARKEGRAADVASHEAILRENYAHFGYGYLETGVDLIPDIPLTYYSFHLMVMIGIFFILFFMVVLYYLYKKKMSNTGWLQYVALWSIPLSFLAAQLGWIVAEVGRQPWTIQDILPVEISASAVSAGNIITTFILFTLIFTGLLAAEIAIMVKQIKKGPASLSTENHTGQ